MNIEKSAVWHVSEQNYCYAVNSTTLNVRLRVKAGDCQKVLVYYKNLYDHCTPYFVKEMQLSLSDGLVDLYETAITIPERHFKYYFELHAAGRVYYYTGDGFLDTVQEGNCFYLPVINDDDILTLPAWAEGDIIYQVLIDRFYDGDSSNNPLGVKPFDALPDRSTYYGGDFQGLMEKLDYIESLGTGIIYLSPLFLSPSYHKYDVADYYRIEEIYGGEEQLRALVQAAHQRGLKIVLDAVFNHCSVDNELFQDVIARGQASPYSSWFIIDSFPVEVEKCNYDTFAGKVPTMPRFNTANPAVIDYLVNVALYWTKRLKIDGWRLDVADEVSHNLWRELRKALKSYNQELLIIGEVWNHACRWLHGDEFDTVTNYKYRQWLLAFAKGEIDSQTLWRKLQGNKALYKTPFHNYLINLLGSHDTIRSATCLKNEQTHYLALLTTLTLEGMPLIYYGDEVAMPGGDDPDNRRAMQWQRQDENLNLIRELGQLRKKSPLLRKGAVHYLPSPDRVLAFKRTLSSESLTVIANFQDSPISYPGNFKEIVFGRGSLQQEAVQIDSQSLVLVR